MIQLNKSGNYEGLVDMNITIDSWEIKDEYGNPIASGAGGSVEVQELEIVIGPLIIDGTSLKYQTQTMRIDENGFCRVVGSLKDSGVQIDSVVD